MTKANDTESKVQHCYSTWGKTYYEEYFTAKASYPPVHRGIVREALLAQRPKALLDAGCGPASMLRDLTDIGAELYGFDLTHEMAEEGRNIFRQKGLDPRRIWEGSVLEEEAFKGPEGVAAAAYDAVICMGVMPHIDPKNDRDVIRNLHASLNKDGLLLLEARNELFGLFTMNRYTYEFIYDKLIEAEALEASVPAKRDAVQGLREEAKRFFRMDLPPIRKGKENEPGYDEVLSRMHNPFELQQLVRDAGFYDVEVLFYHYHAVPPMFSGVLGEEFQKQSLALEDARNWKGYFMCSAFIVRAKKR